jgi:urease accessory protein
MIRATAIVRHLAVKADKVVDTIALDHEGRHRRRVALKGAKGTEFLLDLEKATSAKGGDAFKLEDGRLIQVVAAPEALLEIRAESPARLAKIAWHVGNRHTPAEITADAIYIADDHVLSEMVRGLGGAVARVSRAFEPERGAYDGHGHDHGHGAGHGHGHDHLHVGGHAHEADQHQPEHDHDHGHACGCGHDHHDHGHHDHGHEDHAHPHNHQQGHHHGHGHGPKAG